MMDRHVLSNGYLSAAVKGDGAELCSLCDATETELLWQAGPAWPRHAPVLFPIVGGCGTTSCCIAGAATG